MDDWRTHPITASEVLVDNWLKRLECARKSENYEAFRAISDVCYSFYKNSAKFMWEKDFRRKYMGATIETPMFEITINKAREYIDIYGPYLFWDYPNRKVTSYEPLPMPPELFGDPNDPNVQMQLQAIDQQMASEKSRRDLRCKMMERYLNYSQREQQGGLTTHAADAVRDALIKGRGILVPKTYRRPGSQRTLTGLFYESVDNLRIDPDCNDPHLNSATWVAIRHQWTVRETERHFRLRRGTLNGAGNLKSHENVAGLNGRSVNSDHMTEGKSNDLIVWYEIWSKCGVGGWKEDDHDSELIRALDDVVGDNAYLCVAANVPWLLNAPPEAFTDETTEDEVVEMLGWPFPSYADSRWPMAFLDFYRDSESPWPIAPLSAALGELICMNVLTSAFVEQAYENRKSIIALLDEAAKDFDAAVSGNKSPVVVKMKGELNKTVDQMISFLNRPPMNKDIISALEYVSMLFDKRTGLVDFMYGVQQTQDRSARTTAAKEEKTGIRPERMSRDVAAWQTDGATLEKLLASLNVRGADIPELLGGAYGAMLWDELIYNEDPEVVMREMTCMVEATDLRRPNRERDLQNLQTLSQQFLPVFMALAQETGNTGPIDAMSEDIGKAMEQPTEKWKIGSWEPRPDPMAQQEAEAAAQAEQAKTDAIVQKSQADIAVKQADVESKRQQAQLDLFKTQAELEMDAAKHAQEMQQREQESELALSLKRAEGQQNLMLNRITGAEKIRGMQEQSKAKAAAAKQRPKATNGKP